jgi:ribosomal-protein-alanine N-acetyltransferase
MLNAHRVRTKRLTLVPFGPEHRSEFVRVLEVSREHFRPWFPRLDLDRPPEQAFEEDLERAERGAAMGTDVRLVGLLDDGAIAGFFALSQIFKRSFQNAYASWSVAADQIGRGLATEGVLGLLDVAFSAEPGGVGLHRVQANVIPANLASVRVAEKAGFRLEGVAKRYLKINGLWQDHAMFAKTSEEHSLGPGGEESSNGSAKE